MKNILIVCLLTVSTLSIAQNIRATTVDGKKVVLKSNKTWEYVNEKTSEEEICDIPSGFVEPKGDFKDQKFLKKVGATVTDLKKHISVDRGCNESEITLLQISEQMGNGIYIVCVKGTKYKYRRSGSVFYRDGENPLKLN
ncbi:MAG: hypothetical protein H7195_09265 [Chryseobacterium sp.]|nr:hypothetical protein [Chryseobacterium sp.]